MDRRTFLITAAACGVAAATGKPSEAARTPRPWHLQVALPEYGKPLWTARLFDARTGEEVSNRFPISMVPRVFRSLRTGRPVRVANYRLGPDGRTFLEGENRVAMEAVTILVEWRRV